ncbi:MAG TPA: hypothetical protein QKA14_02435 [Candidatus Megaira endosymbiont of Hartmannula sinica]|nr:hypothetical protein [Candidatus Megaera endosymbiont of Hartmannula sinica]
MNKNINFPIYKIIKILTTTFILNIITITKNIAFLNSMPFIWILNSSFIILSIFIYEREYNMLLSNRFDYNKSIFFPVSSTLASAIIVLSGIDKTSLIILALYYLNYYFYHQQIQQNTV